MALTFNLPSQIVVQTAAQWAVDATVYSNKRILVTSDEYYGSTDQRKFKIADGTQTWANLDFMPISQTLAQVLANGNSTNGLSFDSPDSLTYLLVKNNNIDAVVDNNNTVSEINITPNTIVISTTGASIDLSATSVTKNGSEVITSANITQVITNGVTDKAPSEDAVFDALALKKSSYYIDGVFTGNFSAPADSTTYYYLIRGGSAQLSVSTYGQPFLTTGTITTVAVHALHTNNPTTESVLIYLRNDTTATDYTITLAWNDSYGASTSKSVVYTGLSIPIGNTTDKWVIKIITPAWVTNPTNWAWAWDFLIE